MTELKCERDLEDFVNSHDESNLIVVDISLSKAQPCIRVFPAVLALARSFEVLKIFLLFPKLAYRLLALFGKSIRGLLNNMRAYQYVPAGLKVEGFGFCSVQGYASFGRFLGDSGAESQEVLKKHKVDVVPTFLFFRKGKEIDRLVSSSRADLIGHILQLQNSMGIPPPPPPPATKGQRRKQRA